VYIIVQQRPPCQDFIGVAAQLVKATTFDRCLRRLAPEERLDW